MNHPGDPTIRDWIAAEQEALAPRALATKWRDNPDPRLAALSDAYDSLDSMISFGTTAFLEGDCTSPCNLEDLDHRRRVGHCLQNVDMLINQYVAVARAIPAEGLEESFSAL
jgi:hypothetical protein